MLSDHKLFCHVYADDTQLYCFLPSDRIDSFLDKNFISADDINLWMSANKLKMTEILLCCTNARLKSVCPNLLKIGNNTIDFSPKVTTLVCT